MKKKEMLKLLLKPNKPDCLLRPSAIDKVVALLAIVLGRETDDAESVYPCKPAVAVFNARLVSPEGLKWDTIELAPGVRYFLGQDQF